MKFDRSIIALAALALLAGGAAVAQQTQSVSPELNQKLRDATVYIQTEYSLSAKDWSAYPAEIRERAKRRPKQAGSGSGFLISPTGYIITNAHVVDQITYLIQMTQAGPQMQIAPPGTRPSPFNADAPGEPFTITLTPGALKAVVRSGEKDEISRVPKVVKIDRNLDLALLKIPSKDPLPFLELEKDEARIRAGLGVVMTGFPGGAAADAAPFAVGDDSQALMKRHPRASVNAGLVTAIRENKGEKRYQLDIRANHGNSGGPITDFEGRVLGVLYAGIDSMQSIDYAIPVMYVQKFVPASMIAGGAIADDAGAADSEGTSAPAAKDPSSFDDFVKGGDFSFGTSKKK